MAMALVPLMQSTNPDAAGIVERNMAVFGPNAQPFTDGKDVIFDALKSFATNAGIDCSLLTVAPCEGGTAPTLSVGGPTSPNVAATISASPTANPAASPTTPLGAPTDSILNDMDNETSDDMNSCGSAVDGGVPSKDGGPSLPLLDGAYTPTSNVDHM